MAKKTAAVCGGNRLLFSFLALSDQTNPPPIIEQTERRQGGRNNCICAAAATAAATAAPTDLLVFTKAEISNEDRKERQKGIDGKTTSVSTDRTLARTTPSSEPLTDGQWDGRAAQTVVFDD